MNEALADHVEFITVVYARQFVYVDALVLKTCYQSRKGYREAYRLQGDAVNIHLYCYCQKDRHKELPGREVSE